MHPKIDANIDAGKIGVRMQMFTMFIDFGQGFEKRKTLQNIGRGSKNQGLGFIEKTLRKVSPQKIGRETRKKRFPELPGLVLEAQKAIFSMVFRDLTKLVSRRHANRPGVG